MFRPGLHQNCLLRSSPVIRAAILLHLFPGFLIAGILDEVGSTDLTARLGNREPLPLVTYVPRGDSAWSFRKGLSEPTADPAQWRAPGFAQDATWGEATLPIGYGDGDDVTVLNDMQRRYQTVYLRKTFTLEGPVPTSLLLRLYMDDGAVVWVNNTEVARRHVGEGILPYDAAAVNNEAAWERVLLTGADSYLLEGSNVIAVHAVNQSATSSDFSFDLELLSPRVTVAQVEAAIEVEVPVGSGNFERYFLPQSYPATQPVEPVAIARPSKGETFAGTGDFTGTQIRVQSAVDGVSYSVSSHARTVGLNLYGEGSPFPGLAEVECYSASDWVNRFLALESNVPPGVAVEWIQNHSWVQTSLDDAEIPEIQDALVRIDHMTERDSVLPIVGLNNGSGTTVPPLMATAFNVISVGVTSGNHSRGGTLAPFTQPGRAKPELVAPHSVTSYATATVSSAASFLADEILRNLTSYGEALRPEILKAILMAGATQDALAEWNRSPEAPLDPIYGAGELNLSRSHHILTRGALQPSDTAAPLLANWQAGTAAGGSTASLEFQIPEGLAAKRLTAALCWNRHVLNTSTTGGFSPDVSLPDMALTLKSGGDLNQVIETSRAPVGNVEFLMTRAVLPSGNYVLEVESDMDSDFGIGWIIETTTVEIHPEPEIELVPELRLIIKSDHYLIALLNLVPDETYQLEQSSNLTDWELVMEFVAESTEDDTTSRQLPYTNTFFRLLLLKRSPVEPAAEPLAQ
jgi:hypothetical protein